MTVLIRHHVVTCGLPDMEVWSGRFKVVESSNREVIGTQWPHNSAQAVKKNRNKNYEGRMVGTLPASASRRARRRALTASQ